MRLTTVEDDVMSALRPMIEAKGADCYSESSVLRAVSIAEQLFERGNCLVVETLDSVTFRPFRDRRGVCTDYNRGDVAIAKALGLIRFDPLNSALHDFEGLKLLRVGRRCGKSP